MSIGIGIDVASLPPNAQKILDPNGPAPLKGMAAKGLAPGLKPGETLAVVCALSLGADAHAEVAKKTLQALPLPLLNGALGGEIQPGVLDVIGPIYAKDANLSEKILLHPAIHADTVVAMAGVCSEGVAELIATNEERLLANPRIIEKLYLNKHTRMSTADRILELAVRNDLELTGIPAFEQAKKAIAGELIAEPSEEPSFDDTQFSDAERLAKDLITGEAEDIHQLNEETGQEEVVEKAKPLHAIWAELRAPSKIRLLQLATLKQYDEEGKEVDEIHLDAKALRMLGVRDANPLVALAAIKAPGIGDNEVVRISGLRNVCEDVLREIANNREWTRHYMVKYNLVANPRTPFGHASKWILHLREVDLKTVAKSKDVPGAVQTAAKQQLSRKGK
ncbi:MAG: hypothetical protein KF819_36285 [Labilithrix sp.]|nr:hypothetical protein [Labilithrix sp.]